MHYPLLVLYKGIQSNEKVNSILNKYKGKNFDDYEIVGTYEYLLKFSNGEFDHGKVKDIDWDNTINVMKDMARREYQRCSKVLKLKKRALIKRNASKEEIETAMQRIYFKWGITRGLTEEEYVNGNSYFWTYAVLKDDNWTEVDRNDWEESFKDRFLEGLPKAYNAVIIDCMVNEDE